MSERPPISPRSPRAALEPVYAKFTAMSAEQLAKDIASVTDAGRGRFLKRTPTGGAVR